MSLIGDPLGYMKARMGKSKNTVFLPSNTLPFADHTLGSPQYSGVMKQIISDYVEGVNNG